MTDEETLRRIRELREFDLKQDRGLRVPPPEPSRIPAPGSLPEPGTPRIATLEARLATLEARIAILEARLVSPTPLPRSADCGCAPLTLCSNSACPRRGTVVCAPGTLTLGGL